MGLLRRIFGGGEATPEPEDAPAPTPTKKKKPARKKAAKKPAVVEPEDPASRIDAARERLREEIPPIEDEED